MGRNPRLAAWAEGVSQIKTRPPKGVAQTTPVSIGFRTVPKEPLTPASRTLSRGERALETPCRPEHEVLGLYGPFSIELLVDAALSPRERVARSAG